MAAYESASRETGRRNEHGFKSRLDVFRKGGERVLWVDGRTDALTLRIVNDIRAAGFKCWREKDQIFIRKDDSGAIAALNLNYDH
jgi:hypothetical protein